MSIMVSDIYEVITEEFEGLDAVYEDAIVHVIGTYGLDLLKKHKLVESCGLINGRQLYAICSPTTLDDSALQTSK